MATQSGGPDMKPMTILAALAIALAVFAASAVPAGAAVSSASINGTTATLNLDGADDNVTVSVSGGLLVHGQTTGGLNSGSDWDSATAGDQTVPADGTFGVDVDGGVGNDGVEVNGSPTGGDVFTIAPEQQPGRIVFKRTNLVPFTLLTTTERFQVNGLGGADSLASV